MPWQITFDGIEVSSDDFLLEDLEAAEKASGTPWSISNPLREVKVARAWIAIAMARAGRTDAEIREQLEKLTLGDIKNAFTLTPDEGAQAEADDAAPLAVVGTKGSTSRGSSPGARGGSTGPRRKSAKSG